MTKQKKSIALFIAAFIMVVSLAGFATYRLQAANAVKEDNLVAFSDFRASHEIPESTIFIGTHLIYMEAATDELWKLAQESQNASSQTDIYYKSELAGGTWFNISDAGSLSDIYDEGDPVGSDSDMDQLGLKVEYYTFQDGVTKSAKDDSSICIFDGEYPYWDLYHLDELQGAKLQYDTLNERDSKSLPEIHIRKSLKLLFDKDYRNDTTKQCDEQLAALQQVYDQLSASGDTDKAGVIYKLMAKIDAQRRVEIFKVLVDQGYLQKTIERANGKGYDRTPKTSLKKDDKFTDEDKDGDDDDLDDVDDDDDDYVVEFVANNDVNSALNDGLSGCTSSYNSYLAKMLEEGPSVLAKSEYKYSKAIIDSSTGGYNSSMDDNISKLSFVYNLEEGTIVDKEGELALLDNELLDAASGEFVSSLTQSESDAYQAAKSTGKTDQKVLDGILDQSKSEMEDSKGQLELLISAKKDRQEVTDALDYVLNRITWTDARKGDIPQTDLAGRANDVIYEHIQWLTDLVKELQANDASDNSVLDDLQEQKEDLQEKIDEALDDNRLGEAANLSAQMDALNDKIDEESKKLDDIINDPNASAADKAKANAGLDGTFAGTMNDLKDDIISEIKDGNLDNVADALDIAGSLGALDVIDAIKGELVDKDAPDALINKADEAAKEAGAGDAGNDSSSGSSDGSGSGNDAGAGDDAGAGNDAGAGDDAGAGNDAGAGDDASKADGKADGKGDGKDALNSDNVSDALKLSKDALLNMLDSIMGGPFSSLSDSDKAAMIRAMELLGRDGNKNAADLAADLAKQCHTTNKYIYDRILENTTVEYVEIRCLAKVSGYRYYYDSRKLTAILSKGNATFYGLEVGTKEITLNKKDKVEISGITKFNRLPYCTVDVPNSYFNCVACDIKKSSYGICLTAKMENQAQEIYKEIKGE